MLSSILFKIVHGLMGISADEFKDLKQGDQRVFRKIYDEYVGLLQYVVKRCGAPEQYHDDIVQESFTKLFIKRDEILDGAQIKSWLVTTARNLTIDYQRKKQMEPYDEHSHQAPSAEEPYRSKLHELEVRLLGKLIQEVCHETGDHTLKQFYIDGLSAKEIAQANREAVGTITNRLSRLRKRFGERFKKHITALRDSSL